MSDEPISVLQAIMTGERAAAERPVLAYPELCGPGEWTVVPSEQPRVDLTARIMYVPTGDDPRERRSRAHETAHVALTPRRKLGRTAARLNVSPLVLNSLEDARIQSYQDRSEHLRTVNWAASHHEDSNVSRMADKLARRAARSGDPRLAPLYMVCSACLPEHEAARLALDRLGQDGLRDELDAILAYVTRPGATHRDVHAAAQRVERLLATPPATPPGPAPATTPSGESGKSGESGEKKPSTAAERKRRQRQRERLRQRVKQELADAEIEEQPLTPAEADRIARQQSLSDRRVEQDLARLHPERAGVGPTDVAARDGVGRKGRARGKGSLLIEHGCSSIQQDESSGEYYRRPTLGTITWGNMEILEPRLSVSMARPQQHRAKRYSQADAGYRPGHVHRAYIDGRIFRQRRRDRSRRREGSLLIDRSGSMSLLPSELDRILTDAPYAIIGGYCGKMTHGVLTILARNGKRVEDVRVGRVGAGNTVDLPALQWLARQPAPRIWVSDGFVHAAMMAFERDAAVNETVLMQCHAVCLRAGIIRVANIETLLDDLAAVESLQGGRVL